jgi:hypothetical protein
VKATPLLSLALLAVGCQSQNVAASSPSQPAPTATVPPPDFSASRLAMVVWGHHLKVGDPSESAANVFPNRERLSEQNDLPFAFGNDFKARTWERGDDGFGVIIHDGKIAAALATIGGATQDTLTEILRDEEKEMPGMDPKIVSGQHAVYRFWEDGSQRLMICWFQGHAKSSVTLAIGDDRVLDAIGASPDSATVSAKKVDDILAATK